MNGSQDQTRNQELAQVKTAGAHTGTDPDERKKKCSKCGIEKLVSEFGNRKNSPDGLTYECKLCLYSRSAKWRKNNGKQILITRKNYYIKNKDEIAFKSKEYCLNNKTAVAKRKKKYRIKNKDKMNSDRKVRYMNDPQIRLSHNLSSKIRDGINKNNSIGSKSARKLIGCRIDELKAHLESQFKPGMTWENHGIHGWHMDHIRPKCSFDLTDTDQQKACFHYTNTQPLWARENLSKGSKWEASQSA